MHHSIIKAALATAVAGFLAGNASAADLPQAPVISQFIPGFSWAGHYHGVQAGGIFGDDADGAVAGVYGGWNWDHAGFIVGLDVNANYAFGDADGFLGNVRGRLGFAHDRFLVYGAGGIAGADLGDDGFDTGWTAGGGVEYAAWDHATLRLDYSFYDFDDEEFSTLMLGVAFRNGGLFGHGQ